jgi:hypothetical protein
MDIGGSMKTIRMEIELEYNDILMHGDRKEDIDWFRNDILRGLCGKELILHSNEIGDGIGEVKVLKIHD